MHTRTKTKMKPCVDCGKLIKAVQRKSRCKKCQTKRTKYLKAKWDRTRLGSPKLFKKLKNGRLVPADYGCGVNTNNSYPKRQKAWMSYYNNGSQPSDSDLDERDKIIEEENNQPEADWKRVMMYNWKNGIDEHEEKPTKKQLYKAWKYWEKV